MSAGPAVRATRWRGRASGVDGGRWAGIVDLENVAITDEGLVSRGDMQVCLSTISSHVEGMPVRLATGAKVLRAYLTLIGAQPWGLTFVRREPDAADIALCNAANDFVRSGVTDLVIVSGDHAFSPLAADARLHVVCHADHLSGTLRLAATTVSYLPEPSRPLEAGRRTGTTDETYDGRLANRGGQGPARLVG